MNSSRGAYSRLRPHWQSTRDRNFDKAGIEFPIRLGLYCDWVKTSSVMTYVLVLSAKVRRNEWLWQALDVGNVCGPTFGYEIS